MDSEKIIDALMLLFALAFMPIGLMIAMMQSDKNMRKRNNHKSTKE